MPIAIPLIKTLLFPIAPTTGAINGGEHSNPIFATVNKSPFTFVSLQKMQCNTMEMSIINKTRYNKIVMDEASIEKRILFLKKSSFVRFIFY